VSDVATSIYATRGRIPPTVADSATVQSFVDHYINRVINPRKWNLYAADSERIYQEIDRKIRPVNEIQNRYLAAFRERARREIERRGVRTREGWTIPNQARNEMGQILREAETEINLQALNEIYETLGERGREELYRAMTERRERFVVDNCEQAIREGNQQVIVVYGAGHAKDILRMLSKRNIQYASVIPQGLPAKELPTPDIDNFFRQFVPITEHNIVDLDGHFENNGRYVLDE
jgi:hypothetical protein